MFVRLPAVFVGGQNDSLSFTFQLWTLNITRHLISDIFQSSVNMHDYKKKTKLLNCTSYTLFRELHWLPVRQCIDLKLAVPVYKALHGQLPQYMAQDCQLLTDIGRRSLWSADVLTCAIRRTRTRLGDRSFSVAGPCLWNSLPVTLRDRDISLVQFKRLLKTLLFV